MKRKIGSLLMLTLGLMLLSGCGDKTTVANCYSSEGSGHVIEHVPVSREKTGKEEETSQQNVQHIAVSQTQEVAKNDAQPPVHVVERVVEHVPVTQNYYEVVENDNSTTVNESTTVNQSATVNESTTVNYKEEENTDVQVHVKYSDNSDCSNNYVNEDGKTLDDMEEEDAERDDRNSEDNLEEMDEDGDFSGEEAVCRETTIPTETPMPETTTVPEPTEAPMPETTTVPEPTETPMPETTTVPEPTEAPMPETTTVPESTEAPMPETTTVPELTGIPIPEQKDSSSEDAQNEKLKTPVLSEWKKTWNSAEETSPTSDGVTYQITWDKITGADGYEVEVQSRDSGNEKWSSRIVTVKNPSYSESFSHIEMQMKVRVRAFRKSGITKEYGDWSQEKQLNYNPVC